MKIKYYLKFAFFLSTTFTAIGVSNAQGNFVWGKQLGGTGYDEGRCIKTDASGNIYTVGIFGGTADFDPGSGVFNLTVSGGIWDQDVFISKMDALGNFVWAKKIGGSSYDQAGSIALDASGNIYIVGSFEGTADFDPGTGVFNLTTTGTYDQDPYVCKLDASGNFIWAKQFYGTEPYHYSEGVGIAVDPAGNVYVTGSFQGSVDFNPGAGSDTLTSYEGEWWYSDDIFICKLDVDGNYQWIKRMGGTNSDNASGIALDNAGNILTTGAFSGTADFDPGAGTFNFTTHMGMWGYNQNTFVSKLDAMGNFKWAKKFAGNNNNSTSGIAVDQSGNVYTTGNYQGETDFNPGTGVYNMTPPSGDMYDQDIFVSKLDSAGNMGWTRSMGGPGYEGGSSIAVDIAENVYTIGYFQDSADFNPRSGIYMLSTTGMYAQNIFVSKLNDAGSFLWAKNIGGMDDYLNNQGKSITVDAATNVYFTGGFQGTADIDPGTDIVSFATFGGGYDQDIFIEKLHDTLSTVNVAEQLKNGVNDFKLYPNPSNGAFKITMNLEADSRLTIDIFDIEGQLIKTINLSKVIAGINSIDADELELSNGIYFVKIYNDKISSTLKCIINK